MTKEELIKETKQRYPIGSKFRDLVHGEVFTVSSHYFDSFGNNQQLYMPVEKHHSLTNKTARVYFAGKWADRVDDEQDTRTQIEVIQDRCREMYPIGCEYISIGSSATRILESDTISYSISQKSILAHSGGGYLYKDGEFAARLHKAPQAPVDMNLVQAECKRRFPIGCSYVENRFTIKQILNQDDSTYKILNDSIYAHSGGGLLYKDGVYAKIVDGAVVKSQMEQVQNECMRRFPIGCTYAEADALSDGSIDKRILLQDYETYSIHNNSIYAHSGGGLLYVDGIYAQKLDVPVVTPNPPLKFQPQVNETHEEGLFKEGDHIVCLKKRGGLIDYISPGYVFRQYCDDESAYATRDKKGQRRLFSDIFYSDNDTWRFATKEEIDLYNKNGGQRAILVPGFELNSQVSGGKDISFPSSTTIRVGAGVFREPEAKKHFEEIAFRRIGGELEHSTSIPKLIEEIPFRRI